jgi:metal-responsive CopG/Arc/MetJ family transcriptional regulator
VANKRVRPLLKKYTITISLSLEMIQQVTTTARRLDQSRSQLIEQTLRESLGGNKKRAA